MDFLQQILLSGIFILASAVYYKNLIQKIRREEKSENVLEELRTWKGKRQDFIDFKKYEYTQSFQVFSYTIPFLIFSITLLFTKNEVVSIIGVIPYITLLLIFLYFILKIMLMTGKASQTAIKNIRILLENKTDQKNI